MALARAVDPIGPVQPGVEPLRRVRRRHLARQHEAQFVVEGLRIRLAVEVIALPGPVGPGPGHAVEHLLGGGLRAVALAFGQQRPARPRPRRSATGRPEPCSPRPASSAPARRPCGNISAPERRPRPGSSSPAPRNSRARRRPSRRDCGSRSWSTGIRSLHRAGRRSWYSDARCAWGRSDLPIGWGGSCGPATIALGHHGLVKVAEKRFEACGNRRLLTRTGPTNLNELHRCQGEISPKYGDWERVCRIHATPLRPENHPSNFGQSLRNSRTAPQLAPRTQRDRFKGYQRDSRRGDDPAPI